MWENVGMSRNKSGLENSIDEIKSLKNDFLKNVKIPGSKDEFNMEIEKAGRVLDFIDLGILMSQDAYHREESCGGHFREEYQTDENEAKRNDSDFCYVAAWEFKGQNTFPKLNKEELKFENVELSSRSYK